MTVEIVALLLAAAQVTPPASTATTQALFDAATAATEDERCAEAVAGFEAIEQRPAITRSANVRAVVKLRKGRCLVRLDRFAEATAALNDGLAVLRIDDPTYRNDVIQAHDALGRMAFLGYDYPRARGEFETVRAATPEAERLDALLWLARVTMFDDSGEALAYVEQALALLPPAKGSDARKGVAAVHTLHARALLNHGQAPAAYKELTQALADQGGLKLRVGYADIVTRSDLAIAALLSNKPDDARQYLAYTGAGHSDKAPFGVAAATELPACGGPDDGLPEDTAIVEFGVRDDGSTSHVIPVYASRPGRWVLNYARAVANWSWKQADVATLSPFFRALTRVELRCTTSFARPSVTKLLEADLKAWLAGAGAAAIEQKGGDAAQLVPARNELQRRRAHGDAVNLLPALLAIGNNAVAQRAEAVETLSEASQIAATARAPATAQLAIDLALHEAGQKRFDVGARRTFLRETLARPAVAGDPRAAAAVRLLLAEPAYRTAAPADATALLPDVATDTRLGARPPRIARSQPRRSRRGARQLRQDGARRATVRAGRRPAGGAQRKRFQQRFPERGDAMGVRRLGQGRIRHHGGGPDGSAAHGDRLPALRLPRRRHRRDQAGALRGELSPRWRRRLRRCAEDGPVPDQPVTIVASVSADFTTR